MGTDWKAFADRATFTVEVDGAEFKCVKPSGTQLVARGVLPPGIVLGRLDPNAQSVNGDRHKVLLDEKAQDALLDAVLLEPTVWDGPFDDCPEGQVPRRALASVKDALVVAVLAQVYDTEIVRGASFRGSVRPGGDAVETGETVGASGDGNPRPARGRARGRTRARASGGQGA